MAIFNAIMAICQYGYLRHNGHLAIQPYDHYGVKCGKYGCFRKQQLKCGNLVKMVSQFDHPSSDESKNGPEANFPLYFSDHSFVNAKMDGPAKPKLQKL